MEQNRTGTKISRTIAIDGPAGSGKGTIAKFLANRLSGPDGNWIYVDSGLFYRYLAYCDLHEVAYKDAIECMYSLDKSDKPNSSNLTTLFAPIMHYLQIGEDPQHIIPSLKTESCAGVASKMSQRPEIRHGVNTAIRLLEGNVVIDGRDTTTVIYPNADVKLFVTADVTTRAHRRMLEDSRVQTAQESNNPQEPLLQQYIYAVKERDANDTLRAIAPLRQAIDALLLDTSGLTIEQMCDAALSLVRSRLKI